MAGSRRAYTEPRKSFFQSLEPEERAALLQVAPSLKCVTATASPAYIHASYPPTFNTRPPVTHHLFGSFLFDGSPSPSPVPPHRRNRGKFEEQEQLQGGNSRRAFLPGSSSDDENAMTTPMSQHQQSLQRGVLRSGPPTGAGGGGGSSDLSDDLDDTPITWRAHATPRGGGNSVGGGGGNSAGGFRSNAHVAAAAAGVSPTPYTSAAAAMHRTTGSVSVSRRSGGGALDRDRPPSGKPKGGKAVAAAPYDRAATRDMVGLYKSNPVETHSLKASGSQPLILSSEKPASSLCLQMPACSATTRRRARARCASRWSGCEVGLYKLNPVDP
jgi:hypothetical protein